MLFRGFGGGAFRGRFPAQQGEQREKPQRVGQGDVPAVPDPRQDRPGFGKQVGQGHARRRPEPDHGAAETHRVGQHPPVVAALLQGQRGQGDIVENRGDIAQSERGLPGSGRQGFDRHQGGGQDQRQQENAAFDRGWHLFPSRPPQRYRQQQRDPDGRTDEGEAIRPVREIQVQDDVGRDGRTLHEADDSQSNPIDSHITVRVSRDRCVALLLAGRDHGKEQRRDHGSHVGVQHRSRGYARYPHHRGRGIADHTTRAAGVRCRHDRSQVTDVNFFAVHGRCDRAADHGGGDVVEERGQHEHHEQQHEAALPVIRQEARQHVWRMAVVKMRGEQGDSDEQAEQVREHHPFVTEMDQQSTYARTGRKAGEREFIGDDRTQPRERDRQRVVMEQRDAQQGRREKDEFEWNAGDHDRRRRITRRTAVA